MDRGDVPIGQPLVGRVDVQLPVAELVQPGSGTRPHRSVAIQAEGERLVVGHPRDARGGVRDVAGAGLVTDRVQPVASADPDPAPAVLGQREDIGLHQAVGGPVDPHGPLTPSAQSIAPGADPQAAIAGLEDGVDRVGAPLGARGDRGEAAVMQPVQFARAGADPQVARNDRWRWPRCARVRSNRGGTAPDRAALQPVQPRLRADPEDPVPVLVEGRDRVVAQSAGGRVMMPAAGELLPKPVAGAHPQAAVVARRAPR